MYKHPEGQVGEVEDEHKVVWLPAPSLTCPGM